MIYRITLLVALLLAASRTPGVSVAEDTEAFTLSNEFITAQIDKKSGSVSAMKYKGVNVVGRAYWSQVGRSSEGGIGSFGSKRSSSIRIDPSQNGGERAEVSLRFGQSAGSLPCDVDIRYTLGRGDSGIYAAMLWEHKAGYAPFSVGEARMALKLNGEVFDHLSVDADRDRQMPSGADWDRGVQLNMKEVRRMTTGIHAGEVEHKYDYSAILADLPAYGWSSSTRNVGVWLINPSIEYLAGGPTKVELTGHLDGNAGGAPTLLNMWHGSHYGGSSLAVAKDESWSKFVGPFFIYCNSAGDPGAMFKDAVAKGKEERHQWPYAWETEPAFEGNHRGVVKGRLRIVDDAGWSHLHVGLTAAEDWQRDSKHYQFWAMSPDGAFTIPNVRPGTYTLRAFADGVLGEFARAEITVAANERKDLGTVDWKPVRHGRTLWEIGTPDRSAAEFRHGDHFWQWGLYNDYVKEFPDDVTYVVGKSTNRDWNYCQPARVEGGKAAPAIWAIQFDLREAVHGKADLRLAFAGSRGSGGVDVLVNDQPAGNTGTLPDTGVMHRDGIRGYWFEREVLFDAALLHPGGNTIKLRPHVKGWVDGILYDYLRLELDEG